MEAMTAPATRKPAAAPPQRTLMRDVRVLRRPLVVALVAFLIAVLLIGATGWMRRRAQFDLDQARRVHEAALYKLQNTERERREINQYQPRFLALREQGMVGQENRLAWIDTIRRSQATRRLLSVSYEIEPQQAVTLSAPIALGDYQLRASRMELHMGLLHELDLFNLLDDLRSAGLYTVQECRMKRLEVPPDAANAPRLSADCTLNWATLGPAPPPPAPAAMNTIPGAPPQ